MKDVIAIGELLIDFACKSTDGAGYPTLAAQPGGAPGNFLAALQTYGCSTAMIGKVGDDAFGHLLVGTLQERGIETKGIIIDPKVFTTLAFVTLDATGNREFSFARKPGADTRLTANEVSYDLIDEAKVFHFGTLSLTGEPVRTATVQAVTYAKRAGKLISFDPNLRKPLWDSEASAKELEEIIALVEEYDIPAIFVEKNGSRRSADVIARETGCQVYELDLIMSGDGTGIEPYIQAMDQNLSTILEALG